MRAVLAYAPRSIKRARRTKADMALLEENLVRIVAEEAPTTARHVFYKAVAEGLIPKTEAAYKGIVIRLLTKLRRSHEIPYRSISDNTRWTLNIRSHGSMNEALEDMARGYKRNLWTDADSRVEIWCEKDAVAGIISETASKWTVDTMVFRGYPSLTYLSNLTEDIEEAGVPTFVYYFGDHDPSGVDIERFVTKTVCEMAPDVEIHVKRLAVTPAQIEEYDLPTRPTKTTDTRSKGFAGDSVEIDALDSATLQKFTEDAIRSHLDDGEVERLLLVEQQERETLAAVARSLRSPS